MGDGEAAKKYDRLCIDRADLQKSLSHGKRTV